MYTAAPYGHIRDVMLDSRAVRRIVILDCCYSGRALGQMTDFVSLVVDETSAEGTYVLTATAENKAALAPPGHIYTAFTGELLNIIHNGIVRRGPFLDLDSIYQQLRTIMKAKGFPAPQKRDRNTAGQLALIRNQAFNPPKVRSNTNGTGQTTALAEGAAPALWGTVPQQNKNFTGRRDLLAELGRYIGDQPGTHVPLALYGLGGVGKTQLAIEFAHRFSTNYDLVWWIHAEEIFLVRASLVELAAELEVAISQDAEQSVHKALEALRLGRPYERWLLIYDNASSPQEMQKYLPVLSTGHIIITSRNQEWQSIAITIHIDVFSRKESIELIRRIEPSISTNDADQLAERLGDLPLAIYQAAAWQSQTGMSVHSYLELFEEENARLLSVGMPVDYPIPVAATWRLTFDQLMTESPAAAELLQLCAFFGPEPIPIRIFSIGQHVPGLPAALASVTRDALELYSAIRNIGRYALATINAHDESLQIHPLVQAVLRDRVPPSQQENQQNIVRQLLATANPGNPDDFENWEWLAKINGHVMPSAKIILKGQEDNVRVMILDQIRYLYVRGDYESSHALADNTVGTWQQIHGVNDALTLIARDHLGNSLRALGMTGMARVLDQETLDRSRSIFGADNERTLVAARSYSADLRINGDYREARALDLDNLERHKQVFGPDARMTLRCASDLAVDMRLSGDFQNALILDRDIVERRLPTLGPANHETLFAQCMVARDLRGCGLYREALELYDQVLGGLRALLGDDHQDVLNIRLSHGVTLQRVGQYGPARAEIEDVLNNFRRRFGEEHLGAISAMTVLASPLRLLGEVDKAHALADQALTLARRVHGADHVFSLLYANNLAVALRAVGHHDRALQMDEETFHAMRNAFGADHVFALASEGNLAHSIYLAGDFERAKVVSRDTLERSIRARGQDHPLTQACALALAIDLRAAQGTDSSDPDALSEAERLTRDAIEHFTELVGADNPVTLASSEGKRLEFDIEPPQF